MSMKYSGYFTKKEEDLDPVAKAVRDILNVNKTVEQIAKETDNGFVDKDKDDKKV